MLHYTSDPTQSEIKKLLREFEALAGHILAQHKLAFAPIVTTQDGLFIAIYETSTVLDEKGLPTRYIGYVPVKVNPLIKYLLGIRENYFHVFGHHIELIISGEKYQQAPYMVAWEYISINAVELWLAIQAAEGKIK